MAARLPLHSTWISLIGAAVGGAALGAAAKLADESGIAAAGDLASYLGVWIVIATLIAAWSRSRLLAALCAGTFMFAMVGAYYLATRWLFGVFATSYFLAWVAAALLLAPLFAALTWPSRQQGWLPAFAAALPVGLLLSEGWSFRWVLPLHLSQFVFDIAAAVLLCAVLPRGKAQRMRVLALVPPALLAGIGFQRVLPYIAGALRDLRLRL